jgi:tetratricopeptide (TPR) repeat protein
MRVALFASLALAAPSSRALADIDLEQAETLFRTGKYDECARAAAEEIRGGGWNERWYVLKIESELARGKYAEALATLEAGIRRYPSSVPIRWRGVDVYRYNGKDDDAIVELETIERLILSAPQRFATPQGRLTLGRFFLKRGADARKVLDQFYDVAVKQAPEAVDAYLATAELALVKQDYALAAQTLAKAPKSALDDPRYSYLLALAFVEDNRKKALESLQTALKLNPSHADSLLFEADHLIDSERYAEATDVLKRVFAVNPSEPRAWAYTAAIAHLRNDPKAEASARKSALEHWATNPEVDHILGRKLSQKYRFAEGSEAQKRALAFDRNYLPANIQLCQDLLRLGNESEGWSLAAEIFAKDGYNVVAFNLITLRDRIHDFRTLQGDGFLVRMDAREAELYGPRVLALLSRAKKTLGETYGVKIEEPVIVEIFPAKKEFAVRTFGLPGADGFLGVCFGRVVTANSPASQGEHPSNWEAVLWHEYCHVVTLSKTHNKMPRWLSEGISVYEEGRADPSWKEATNPKYRAMLLGDELTPLSKLSSAFLAPKSALHLQFAYHESALAVEFLVKTAGMPALKALLDDLGAGISINEALPKQTKMTLDVLDREFTRFARERAQSIGKDLTWEDPEDLPPDADSQTIKTWLEAHPRNFHGRRRLAATLLSEGKLKEAKPILEALKSQYPEFVGPENPYVLLAAIYRKTSDSAAERAVLEELAAIDGDASSAYLRLMEIYAQARDDKNLAKNARRLLAVNPLIASPHRQLALAAERLGERDEAVSEYRALALLDDTDPAGTHFHLAKLLQQVGKPAEARREVLKALDAAPRFLDAHALLLELTEADKTARPGGAHR